MQLNFQKHNGLVPAIIQDAQTCKVLMLGFMNKKALSETEKTGYVTFFSRTKKRLWTKGETSGNYLKVKKIIADCDNDTLLIKAEPTGAVCHTGNDTCFGEKNKKQQYFINELEKIISDRKKNPQQNSYTNKLLEKGIKKIAQKVGEEAVELVLESENGKINLFLNEAADLLYHYLVLLHAKGFSLNDVEKVLMERHTSKSK